MVHPAKLILLLSFVTMTGCASTGKTKFINRIETITVYKPVYTPPTELKNLKVIQRPDLQTNHLTADDKANPGLVVKTVIASEAQLRTYAEQLESQNDAYRKLLSKPADPVPETERSVTTYESTKPIKD